MLGESLRATHRNGTVTTTPAKVQTRRGRGFRLDIRNATASGGNGLQISFDSGKTWYTLAAQESKEWPVVFPFFYLRGVSGNADYEALLFEG